MATQPLVAMGFKAPEFASPLNMMTQVSQLQAAQEANALRQLQAQQLMRAQEQENALRSRLSSGAPMSFSEAAAFGAPGLQALTAQRAEIETQEKRQADKLQDLAEGLMFVRKDPSLENFSEAFRLLKSRGLDMGSTAAEIMLMNPEDRKKAVDRFIETTPGMSKRLLELDKIRTETEAARVKGEAAASQASTAAAKLPFERLRSEAAALQATTAADKAKFERENPGFTIQETDQGLFKVNKRTGAMEPLMLDGQQLRAPDRRPLTTVNIDRGEQAETVERGKGYVAHETEVRKAAAAARRSLTSIESAQDVLSKDFETGFGKETLAKGASVLAALGVDKAEKFATDAQKFLQAATERVLAAQLEQKGVQTNQDAQRIEQTGARMGNTKAANEFILDVARAQAERAIAQDKFYRDWLRDPANKKSLAGAEDAWLESEGGKSIFESPRLKKYNVLQAERAQATPPPTGPVVGARSATPRGTAPSEVPAFRTVHEAEAANLPKGTRITVGGRPAEVN